MNEVFDIIECSYPVRNELRFKSRNICTVRYSDVPNKRGCLDKQGVWKIQ